MADSALKDEVTEAHIPRGAKIAYQQKKGADELHHNQSPTLSKPTRPASSKTPLTSVPSAAAIHRALASQGPTPKSFDGALEGTKDRLTRSGESSPSWPTSPRLKSPPPNATKGSSRRNSSEQAQSNTAKRLAPASAPELAAAMLLPDGGKEQLLSQPQSTSHLRVPPRTTNVQNHGLETVVEGSVPTTPSIDAKMDPMDRSQFTSSNSDLKDDSPVSIDSTTNLNEIKSDAAISKIVVNKADNDARSRAPGSRASSNLAKRSFTSLTGNKKAALEPPRTMTVETEFVNASTPGLGDRNRDAGSVRTKTSTETIRPKKEKKKPPRKPTNLHVGGATSKADIFEHKVATAVDEADTSDSDETFVYESNPPEPRSYRHHSRTPSSTSMASTHDQYRGSKHGIRNGSTAIPGKKSMKFSNSIHQREYEDDASRPGSKNTATPRHHHIGRYGRNGHPSLFDSESPFSQARQPSSPRNVTGGTRTSRPSSPRIANGRVISPRKYGGSAYDNNEDVADDERAPLIGTVRVSRNRHSKRPHSREYRTMDFDESDDRRWWRRCSNCVTIFFLLLMMSALLAAFVAGINRPLVDVEIRKITNVLASEQELMLDLDVRAINPNVFAISIMDLDVNIFAESPYVGTTGDWHEKHPDNGLRLSFTGRRKRGWFWPDPPAQPADGVDEGTDPDDPEGIQKMLLGRVSELDSPLTFDPTPMRRTPASSVGEIRLSKPGNRTEIGGSQRWERVLQHDFDLIVRGVLKYQLPLGGRTRTVKVGSRKTVHPASEDKSLNGTRY